MAGCRAVAAFMRERLLEHTQALLAAKEAGGEGGGDGEDDDDEEDDF